MCCAAFFPLLILRPFGAAASCANTFMLMVIVQLKRRALSFGRFIYSFICNEIGNKEMDHGSGKGGLLSKMNAFNHETEH